MLKGPILFAMAMHGDEAVSPIMACTWAGFVQFSFDSDFSFPLISSSATFTPLAIELHVS